MTCTTSQITLMSNNNNRRIEKTLQFISYNRFRLIHHVSNSGSTLARPSPVTRRKQLPKPRPSHYDCEGLRTRQAPKKALFQITCEMSDGGSREGIQDMSRRLILSIVIKPGSSNLDPQADNCAEEVEKAVRPSHYQEK